MLIINAVKEQQAQIGNQQQQIKQQQNLNQQQLQIKRQQDEIEELKKLVCLDRPKAEVCKHDMKP